MLRIGKHVRAVEVDGAEAASRPIGIEPQPLHDGIACLVILADREKALLQQEMGQGVARLQVARTAAKKSARPAAKAARKRAG